MRNIIRRLRLMIAPGFNGRFIKRTIHSDNTATRKSEAPSHPVSIGSKHMKTPSTHLSLNKFRTMRRSGFFLASSLIVLTILIIGVFVVQAAALLFWRTDGNSGTWTGSNWSNPASATGGTAWVSGDDAEFSADSTVTYVTGTSIGNVTVDAGKTVTVTAAGTMPVGSHVFTVGSGATLTWTGQNVSSGSASSFDKEGTGIWNIGNQANNYTGGFTLGSGTVIVTGAKSFGTAGMTINGGTIQSSGGITFAPTSLTIGGDFTFTGTGNDIWGATVDLGSSTRTITNNTTGTATRTFSNVISGGSGAGLNFAGTGGSGGIVLSGVNTYTGGTTVSAGLVKLSGSGTLGATSGSLTVNGGTLDLNGTSQGVGNLTGSGGTILNNATGTNVTLTIGNNNGTGGNYQGVIANNTSGTGTVALTKTGTGTITLSGTNTYTGLTTVSAGTLKLNKSGGGTIPSGDSVTINGGNLQISSNQTINNLTMSSGTLTVDPGVTLTIAGTYNATGGTINNQGTIKLSGGSSSFPGSGVTVNNGAADTMSNLEIASSGVVTLTSSIIISGQLTVTTGTFDQGASFDLTAGTISVGASGTLRNLGTGDLIIGTGGVANAGAVNYNANGIACGDTDDILIRSTSSGVARSWSGAGTYSFTDVDVKDQSATPPITVRNGTDSGNNTGWVFISACATAGQTYTWTPVIGDTDWQNPLNWTPNRVTPSPDDVIVFNGTNTSSPTVTNVPTQTIGALQLTNITSVMMSTSAANTLTISSGTSTAFSIPSSNSLTLQGTFALRISLTSGSLGSVGGTMVLQEGAHQLTATGGSIVTFNSGAIFTTAPNYNSSTNPFGTGTGGSGSNNSIVFASGSNYFHNNGGSPFGSAGSGPVVVFQTGSTANWLTSNGFQASGRTYANLVIGNPSTQTTVSDSGTGNFQFDNLTVNSTGSNNSTLTFTGSGSSTVTIQGDITSTGTGTATVVSDVSLTAGSGGIILNKSGTQTFSGGGGRTITFGSNATVNSGTTLALSRNLIVTPTLSSTLIISNGATLTADVNGYVIGNLRKFISGSSATFEVGTGTGTDTGYSPVTLSSVLGTGDFTVRATKAPMPNLLNPGKALQRYWTLANGGLTSAKLSFQYLDGDVIGTSDETKYKIIKDTNGAPPITFPEGATDNVFESTNTAATANAVSTFSNWSAAEPNAVTVVRMEGFNALSFNNGNLVKWQTGYEVDNLGFNVYRMSGGKLVRITPSIVAGSALLAGRTALTAGLSYTWWDAKGLHDSQYYVEDIDLNGTRTMHGPITPEFGGNMESPSKQQAMLLSQIGDVQADPARFVKGYPASKPTQATSEQQSVEPQTTIAPEETLPTESLPTESLPSEPTLKKGMASRQRVPGMDEAPDIAPQESRRVSRVATISAPTSNERSSFVQDSPLAKQRTLAAGIAVKIAIRQPGWYRVSQAELSAAGLDSNVNPNMLQLYADGIEQPILVRSSNQKQLGADGSIEFYGTGMDTVTSDKRTYWLVVGSEPGKRINGQQSKSASSMQWDESSMQSAQDTPAKTTMELPSEGFSYTVERKDRIIYFTALLNGEADNFFGPVVNKTPAKQDVTLSNIDSNTSVPATLEVSLQGVTMQAHKVKVIVNGYEVGMVDFANQERGSEQFQIPPAYLVEGNNSITLASTNGDTDISFMDYVRLTYWRTYRADNDQLTFTSSKTTPLLLEGFTSQQVRVFDISNPDAVEQVSSKIVTKGSGFAVKVAGGRGSTRLLLAVADSQVQHPVGITANELSNLSGTDNRADFIILTHRTLRDAVRPLADLRRSQGLETMVVDVEDVYDEFSYGAKSRDAIKDFLALAKNTWALAPRYVLFVGDASIDPRNYVGFGSQDLVPTKLVDASTLETSSDDALADFDGDGLADMAVGRLPAQTPQQAQLVIGKITNYTPGQTMNGALLVSDHLEGYDFEAASNQVRSLLPASLSVTMVNRREDPNAQVKSAIIEGINAGPLLVNYAGHGSSDVWTGAKLLSASDAVALTNGNRLPLFVIMTCLNGRFQDPFRESLAEALMRADNGGAVAVWASSGLTEPDAQSQMDQQLMRLLFTDGQSSTLGDAVRGAKHATNDQDVRKTWILFGDPTMRIR
jgi:autotransporter-associated beta strand protein